MDSIPAALWEEVWFHLWDVAWSFTGTYTENTCACCCDHSQFKIINASRLCLLLLLFTVRVPSWLQQASKNQPTKQKQVVSGVTSQNTAHIFPQIGRDVQNTFKKPDLLVSTWYFIIFIHASVRLFSDHWIQTCLTFPAFLKYSGSNSVLN